MSISRVYHGGSAGKGSWPSSGGSILPTAVIIALNSPNALPILQAMAEGVLAVKDHTSPATQPIPGYDLIYNDSATGDTYIEYPDGGIDQIDLTTVSP